MKKLKQITVVALFALLAACSTGTQKSASIVDQQGGVNSSGIDDSGSLEGGYGSEAKDPNAVYFDLNLYNIKPEYDEVIDRFAASMRENSSQTVRIDGYADESGSREWNLTLSEYRANAVKKALQHKGVNGSRIEVAGYGQEYPVAACAGKLQCWQNRRAVIHVNG